MKVYSNFFDDEFDTDQLDKQYGTIKHAGVTLWLTEQAVCDNYGTDGGVRYYAKAIGSDGNTYNVAWDTTEAWDLASERAMLSAESNLDDKQTARLAELDDMALPDVNDESNACDWGTPARITEA
jgi:hypothetical protein